MWIFNMKKNTFYEEIQKNNNNNLSSHPCCVVVVSECVFVTPKYLSRGISDVSDRYKPDKKLPYFLGNPC